MATTFYPHWVWMGSQLKKFNFPMKDNIYYIYPGCIPFLSTFYLPHLLTSLTGSFRVLQYSILAHYIFGSLLAFYMFSKWASPEASLFGAITLFYSGYSIKIQQPTIIYTMAWMPGIFLGGWLGVLSMAMVFYAGYYPILIYLMPFILVMHTKTVLLGAFLALPQLIPFLWYYLKSVRTSLNFKGGKVPFSKLIEFIIPVRNRVHTDGVMFMEMQMYSGIAFLFIFLSHSRFWLVLGFGILIAVGVIRAWDRIPARAFYIVTLSLAVLATDGLTKLNASNPRVPFAMFFLQAVLLLFNRDIYPSFPFTQWWEKPFIYYKKYVFPGTHYLEETRGPQYAGAFSLK